MKSPRFEVYPIADENCDSLNTDVLIGAYKRLPWAKKAAREASCNYGAGILDKWSGEIDVGFGFGEPAPELPE